MGSHNVFRQAITAIAGQADVFVTGDTAIQRLGGMGQMRIVSPRAFWDYLHAQ
jgi:predicted nucleic acid-binding protein